MVVGRNPLLKSTSDRPFLTKMPLSDVRCAIVRVVHQLRENTKPAIKWDTVSCASVRVRPGARHERRARRRADWMSDIRALEHYRFRGKFVQIRRVHLRASVTCDRVRSLLVRKEQN